jgi:MFS family permease
MRGDLLKGQLMTNSQTSHNYILLTLSLSLFCAMLGVGVISPILPIYASKLGASGIVLGFVFGTFSFARTGGMLISGELAERFDRKLLLGAGLLVYSLASLAYVRADNTVALVAIRFFHGLGSAFVIPIAMAIGADIAEEGNEGRLFGTLQGAHFLGVGFGPLISGILTDRWGWQLPFYFMTVLTSLALFMVIRKLPHRIPTRAQATGQTMFPAIKGMLRNWALRICFYYQFCFAMCRGTILMLIPLLAQGYSLSFSQIGIILSLNSIATGALQRFFGPLSDTIERHRLIVFGGILSGVVFLVIPYFRSFLGLTVASIIFGVGHALSSPSLAAITAENSAEFGSGRTMSIFNIFFSLGMMTGPILDGFVVESGLKVSPFHILSFMIFSATIPFLFFPKKTASGKESAVN